MREQLQRGEPQRSGNRRDRSARSFGDLTSASGDHRCGSSCSSWRRDSCPCSDDESGLSSNKALPGGFLFFVPSYSLHLQYLQSNPVVPRDQMAGTLAVEGAADLLGPPVADLDVQLHAENH